MVHPTERRRAVDVSKEAPRYPDLAGKVALVTGGLARNRSGDLPCVGGERRQGRGDGRDRGGDRLGRRADRSRRVVRAGGGAGLMSPIRCAVRDMRDLGRARARTGSRSSRRFAGGQGNPVPTTQLGLISGVRSSSPT